MGPSSSPSSSPSSCPIPFALCRQLLAPVIHPMSSGSQGWARVLGRSPSLGASPSFVVVVPPPPRCCSHCCSPPLAVPPSPSFPPRRYSPPSPLFPLHRCSRACRGCRRGWGWRGVLVVGCSHCLPPVFLLSVVLHVMVVRRWPSLALECWASGSVSLAVPCPSLSSLVGRHPASRGSQRRHRAG